jgi:hypothetical protein
MRWRRIRRGARIRQCSCGGGGFGEDEPGSGEEELGSGGARATADDPVCGPSSGRSNGGVGRSGQQSGGPWTGSAGLSMDFFFLFLFCFLFD